jgi:hypothetical protein
MATPDDSTIEPALRNVIQSLFRAEDFDNLTRNRIRQRTEEALDLEPGWFKNNTEWKKRSGDFIDAEVESLEREEAEKLERVEADKPPTPKKSAANGKKRASVDTVEKPKKKQKVEKVKPKEKPVKVSRPTKARVVDSEDEAEADEDGSLPQSPVAAPVKSDVESDLSSLLDEPVLKPKAKSKPLKKPSKKARANDSDLSSLDDDPPSKKKVSKTKSSKPKASKVKDSTSTTKDDEIKTLQGWLLKCGIRKKWATVLAPYDTPSEKIRYLKDELKGLGMDGRYTAAKAKEIKEQRELAAELEAVQEFANDWGKAGEELQPRRAAPRSRPVIVDEDDESGDSNSRDGVDIETPRKKLAEYDFGDEDSG